jgi:hypothetical protein
MQGRINKSMPIAVALQGVFALLGFIFKILGQNGKKIS